MASTTDATDAELLDWLDGKFMQWVVSTGRGAASDPIAPLGKALRHAQELYKGDPQVRARIARADEPIVIEHEQLERLWSSPAYLKHPRFRDW